MINDKFTETYLKVIKQWREPNIDAYHDRQLDEYLAREQQNMYIFDAGERYDSAMRKVVPQYLDEVKDNIEDWIETYKEQGKWDKLTPEGKSLVVLEAIKQIVDKKQWYKGQEVDLQEFTCYEEGREKQDELFYNWVDSLDELGLSEYNFVKKSKEQQQPEQQIEQCGGDCGGGGAPAGSAPCGGGPVGGGDFGGPGPGPGGPAGGPPPPPAGGPGFAPPPPPKPVAGIGHYAIRPLLVPAIPYGWYSRGYANPYAASTTSTKKKKKKKKVKRRKKS